MALRSTILYLWALVLISVLFTFFGHVQNFAAHRLAQASKLSRLYVWRGVPPDSIRKQFVLTLCFRD
jgi:hypothetical protein